jgi:uncharacterized protein (TIGR00725 family)
MGQPIIGVMGSHSEKCARVSEPLGKRLALEGFHLLTGGGGGVMEAVTEAFVQVPPGNGPGQRKGLAIGIVPGRITGNAYKPKNGYPNEFVELAIRTHLPLSGRDGKQPLSRNHINVLTSDYVVVLPGGDGTRTEAELCKDYNKPTRVLNSANDIDDLIVSIKKALASITKGGT